jgi:hypothetical protein
MQRLIDQLVTPALTTQRASIEDVHTISEKICLRSKTKVHATSRLDTIQDALRK